MSLPEYSISTIPPRPQLQRLNAYIDQAFEAQEISEQTAQIAHSVLRSLEDYPLLSLPDASYGEGYFIFTWDKEEHHFEIEIEPTQTLYYFYENRATREIWSHEEHEVTRFEAEILSKLALFA